MTMEEMIRLPEEFGVEISKAYYIHDDPIGGEYVISYKGIIVGSELVSVEFVRENIKRRKRMMNEARYEKHDKLVEIAEERGDSYGRLTMLMDLELCDETFELDLDKLIYAYNNGYDCFFWAELEAHIDREKKSFNGWIPQYATKVTYSKYENKAKELTKNQYYSIPQVLGFIHDLYQEGMINEPEENYLYNSLDPAEQYNEVYEYWCAWPYDNPLIK